ncbi:hypothetical protein ACFY2R_02570 [Micromonospora olivasterospora]|uniref:hypothetical protein n=1 Tax=Micromonospora olivasterospora TaxID=1880 RepID=UPI0011A0903B|nr:hypothetical protein [Micromonospora olivasterospora]
MRGSGARPAPPHSFRTAAYCSDSTYGWGVWKWGPRLPAGTNRWSYAYCDSDLYWLVDAYVEKRD